MPINNVDELVSLLTGGGAVPPRRLQAMKVPRIDNVAAAATVAAQWTSLWRYNGMPGTRGAIPGAAAACDRTTQGALPWTNATGGRTAFLTGRGLGVSQAGIVRVYDRLLHNGGLSGALNTAQTVGGTITRNTGGVGNEIWIEIYGVLGGTTTTVTASYTNQNGVAGRTTIAQAIGGAGASEAQRMILLPLADGDTGVQSVQSVTLAASTGTAGSFGITICRPVIEIGNAVGGFASDSLILQGGPVAVDDNACLSVAFLANGTVAPWVFLNIPIVEST